jgi:hypothetical protein
MFEMGIEKIGLRGLSWDTKSKRLIELSGRLS